MANPETLQKLNECHKYMRYKLSNDIQEAFLAGWNAAIKYEQNKNVWTKQVPDVDRMSGAFDQYEIDNANKW